MTIKVKLFDKNCKFETTKKGDWIDLKSRYDVTYAAPVADRLTKNKTVRKVNFEKYMLPLGIGMKLPKGYEAIVAPRSSSYKNYGFIVPNSIGIIDHSYSGPSDEWNLPIIPIKDGRVKMYDRVCQFRIQLNQFATPWQKLKWVLGFKPKFEFVDDYEGKNRGGFGSTGVN